MANLRTALLGALAMGLVGGAIPTLASAEAITTSSAFEVDFSSSPAPGVTASATADFSNFVFSGASVTFNMDITNTTSGTYTGDLRLVSLGWDTAPASTAVTNTITVYASTTNTNLSSTTVSVCLYAGPNCSGGSNGGLEDPNNTGLHGDPTTTGIFSVTIDFGTIVPPLDFSNFIGKFQTQNYSSFDAPGTVCTVGCGGPSTVPEPASMLIIGSGLLGLGLLRRRWVR